MIACWLSAPDAELALALLQRRGDRASQRHAARQWLQAELQQRQPCLLRESSHGPQPDRGPWRVSLSYGGDFILCGLSRHGQPGVDLCAVDDFAGLHDVATLYFGPQWPGEQPQQAQRFAEQWSELEARSKACLLPLAEWQPAREQTLAAARLLMQQRHGDWVCSAVLLD